MTPELPSDPPLRAAWLREGPFTYTDEGEGPVLVALHGLPGSTRDWRWLAPALDGVRLVRLDQPGFGGTPRKTAPGITLRERTRFVLDALHALDVRDFVVLGHSMGGPLAISVAEHARGLALFASVGLRPHRMIRKMGRYPDLPRAFDAPLIGRLLLPPMRRRFARAGFPESTPDEAILQSMRIVSRLPFADVRDAVARVRCPTLLAWALDDPLVEEAIGLELASALPSGPRVTFDDGGHNIQKSRAIELGRALSRFVLDVGSG